MADRDALIARIRTERGHLDAVFELVVHELCLRSGMRILAIEPNVPGTTKKPDFLVETEGGRFYLECAVARGESDADAAARSRRDDVLRAIDEIASPDFLLAVDVEGTPESPVALRPLKEQIKAWFSALDYATIASTDPDATPRYEEELNGMLLSLRPIARQKTRGEIGGRSTGILSDGIRMVAPWESMREPLLRKAGRYGQPDLPLVVALNIIERDARLDHAMEALYGTAGCRISADGTARPISMSDGVWYGPRGPQCTRLSAVLVVDRLNPWTFGQRQATFIENLWSPRNTEFIDFRVPSRRRIGSKLHHQEGITLQEALCVPANWPEQES